MKQLKAFMLLIFSFTILLQAKSQKIVQQAKLSYKVETTLPDNMPGGDPGGEGGNRRIAIGGVNLEPGATLETNTTVVFKNKMRKEITNTDFGKTTSIYNNETEKLITLSEMMGTKSGYYSMPEDREKQQKLMDSLIASHQNAEGNRIERKRDSTAQDVTVEYVDENMKIAGQTCKKAILKWKDRTGERSVEAWYLPDVKMSDTYSKVPSGGGFGGVTFVFAGGRGGGGGRGLGGGVRGLEKINGFVMKYEMSGNNGYKMVWEVTKIEMDTEIDDKEFEVPKGFELKPQSEMMNNFRGGMRRIERINN